MADKGAFKGYSLLCFVSGAWLVAGKKNSTNVALCKCFISGKSRDSRSYAI